MQSIKVFKITDTRNSIVYYVRNKSLFCVENGLTIRLLSYTREGKRNHHKGYILDRDKYIFIPDKDGLETLYDTGENGVVMTVNQYEKEKEEIDDEYNHVVKELVKTQRNVQRLRDNLRIVRKINRKNNREINIEEDFINNVVDILKDKVKYYEEQPMRTSYDYTEKAMLVQLSDLHIGKTVDLEHNKYNYKVAKKRLSKYLNKIVEYGQSLGVNYVTVAITGDLFNLDNHFDSLLTNEDNRANSFVEGLEMITHFIDVLYETFDRVNVIGVVGNESRIRTTEYQSNNNAIASNSFDTLLFKILKKLNPNVNFIGNCDTLSEIVKIKTKTIGIVHGDKFKHNKDEVYKLKSRLIEQYNTNINYIIFGHIHSTLITPTFARSGSLVGADEYAFNGLNISESRASQNIYIIDDEITAIEIKL